MKDVIIHFGSVPAVERRLKIDKVQITRHPNWVFDIYICEGNNYQRCWKMLLSCQLGVNDTHVANCPSRIDANISNIVVQLLLD